MLLQKQFFSNLLELLFVQPSNRSAIDMELKVYRYQLSLCCGLQLFNSFPFRDRTLEAELKVHLSVYKPGGDIIAKVFDIHQQLR